LARLIWIAILFFHNPSVIAEDIPLALTHIDTISVYCGKIKSRGVEVDFLKIKGSLILSTAIWIPPNINGSENAINYVWQMKNCILKKISNNNNITIIENQDDIKKVIAQKRIGIIFTVEGGEPIEDLRNIKKIKEMGIKGISLTWSRDNTLASAHNTNNDYGLTEKGKSAIELLNQAKIMIDISHASDKTIEDILRLSKSPIYASHSNSRTICNTKRNLTDEQIKKIAKNGGIIGISFHSQHLTHKKESYIDDVFAHIKHIKEIAGSKSIALGSDFDGHINTPVDLKNVEEIQNLVKKLKAENWTDEEIEGILYKNFLRFFESVVGN
jgi:membrane dipeptidase